MMDVLVYLPLLRNERLCGEVGVWGVVRFLMAKNKNIHADSTCVPNMYCLKKKERERDPSVNRHFLSPCDVT